MSAEAALRSRIEPRHDTRVVGVGVRVNNARQQRVVGKLRRDDHCRRLRPLQLLAVFRAGDERDLARPCRKQRTNLRNEQRSVTLQHPAQTGDDFV